MVGPVDGEGGRMAMCVEVAMQRPKIGHTSTTQDSNVTGSNKK